MVTPKCRFLIWILIILSTLTQSSRLVSNNCAKFGTCHQPLCGLNYEPQQLQILWAQGGDQEWGTLCAGKTGRTGLQIVRYFQKILCAQFLHLLIPGTTLKSFMVMSAPCNCSKPSQDQQQTFVKCVPGCMHLPLIFIIYTDIISLCLFGAVFHSPLRMQPPPMVSWWASEPGGLWKLRLLPPIVEVHAKRMTSVSPDLFSFPYWPFVANIPSSPLTSSEKFLRTTWDAVFWAQVLILHQIQF